MIFLFTIKSLGLSYMEILALLEQWLEQWTTTAMIHISVPYPQLTCYVIENGQPISISHSLPTPAWMVCPFSIP